MQSLQSVFERLYSKSHTVWRHCRTLRVCEVKFANFQWFLYIFISIILSFLYIITYNGILLKICFELSIRLYFSKYVSVWTPLYEMFLQHAQIDIYDFWYTCTYVHIQSLLFFLIRPYIYGPTSQGERMQILQNFNTNPKSIPSSSLR